MVGSQRLVVRRTRLIGAQAELWPDWRHFAFLTNRTEALEIVEAEHRAHAVVELAIRDLKDEGLAHFPSGQFDANAARTVIACLAHNLLRWTTLLALPDTIVRTARTVRRRLPQIPGRLTRTARRWTLHLPARWPRQHDFTLALAHIRALPPPARRGPPPPRRPAAVHAAPAHTSCPRTDLRRLRASVPSGSPPPDPPHSIPTRLIAHAHPGRHHHNSRSVDPGLGGYPLRWKLESPRLPGCWTDSRAGWTTGGG
jgi:hypothetical protein